ncbi:MAG: GNAT family N-acetyltransferase [Erysipelotrichaceae bacterium]
MILETAELRLREYRLTDLDQLYQILSDPITMAHYPKPYDYPTTKRWIEWNLDNYQKYGFGLWAIELKENGQFIGDCGITMQNIDGDILPEIGYHLDKRYWRKGYGKQAAKAVRDWGFTHKDFACLYSYMSSDNIASYATAEAAGMVRIKEYQDKKEKLFVYAITRERWLKGYAHQ